MIVAVSGCSLCCLLLLADSSSGGVEALGVAGEGGLDGCEIVASLRKPVTNHRYALPHHGPQRPYGRRDDQIGCHGRAGLSVEQCRIDVVMILGSVHSWVILHYGATAGVGVIYIYIYIHY